MASNITHGRVGPTRIIRSEAQAAREESFMKNWAPKFPRIAKAKAAR